jgi:hypothetical protein
MAESAAFEKCIFWNLECIFAFWNFLKLGERHYQTPRKFYPALFAWKYAGCTGAPWSSAGYYHVLKVGNFSKSSENAILKLLLKSFLYSFFDFELNSHKILCVFFQSTPDSRYYMHSGKWFKLLLLIFSSVLKILFFTLSYDLQIFSFPFRKDFQFLKHSKLQKIQ